jgi:hypothetical protein
MQQRLQEAAFEVEAGLDPPAGTDTLTNDAKSLNNMVET